MPSVYIRSSKGDSQVLARAEILPDGTYLICVLKGRIEVGDKIMGPGDRFVWASIEQHKKLTTRPAPWQYKNWEAVDEDKLDRCPKCETNLLDGDDYLCQSCR